jgi:hypothetical protein
MAVLVTAVPVMSPLLSMLPLSMVPGGSFPFYINPLLSFDMVGAATVDHDVYTWRCRHVAVDVDIHIRDWQAGRNENVWNARQSGLCFTEPEGAGDCCH